MYHLMPRHLALAVAVATALAVTAIGHAGDGWEMRVCAPPNAYPASSADRPGYDNRIAEILADDLGARLAFEWVAVNETTVRTHLMAGACDLALGLSEGVSGTLSTVPYYRAPFVFLHRSDAPFRVTSLDDPVLRDLRIVTYRRGVGEVALHNRGFDRQLLILPPVAGVGGIDRDAPLLAALEDGRADVAILYGPIAGDFVRKHPGAWTIAAVTPEIDLPLLQLFRVWTIGVRPGDDALRNALNEALARRWDEIQAVFAEYHVPLASVNRPPAPRPVEDRVAVGVVAPHRAGAFLATDAIGEGALRGALVAQNLLVRRDPPAGLVFDVLDASAPTPAATRRAAERLLAVDRVQALVGGFGREDLLALAEVGREAGVAVLNIATIDDDFRTCGGTLFHLEASASMLLAATMSWHAGEGVQTWFVVQQADPDADAVPEVMAAVAAAGGTVVGSAAVLPGQFAVGDVVDAIAASAPDAVLVLLEPTTLQLFVSQTRSLDERIRLVTVSQPIAQTREFLVQFRQASARAAAQPRAVRWEASVSEGSAGDINLRYASRNADPMDPTGWAAYAAVTATYEAAAAIAAAGDRVHAAALVDWLRVPGRELDLGLTGLVAFDAATNQLGGPMLMVAVDPQAPWGERVSQRVAIAHVVGEVTVPLVGPVTSCPVGR